MKNSEICGWEIQYNTHISTQKKEKSRLVTATRRIRWKKQQKYQYILWVFFLFFYWSCRQFGATDMQSVEDSSGRFSVTDRWFWKDCGIIYFKTGMSQKQQNIFGNVKSNKNSDRNWEEKWELRNILLLHNALERKDTGWHWHCRGQDTWADLKNFLLDSKCNTNTVMSPGENISCCFQTSKESPWEQFKVATKF